MRVTFFYPLLCLLLVNPNIHAGSANWSLDPTSNDWYTSANWIPATVPNGISDIATFGTSSQTVIHIPRMMQTDLAEIHFLPGASEFTTRVGFETPLIFHGAGIVNESGQAQHFVTRSGIIWFIGNATTGAGTSFHAQGGSEFQGGGLFIVQDDVVVGASDFTVDGAVGNFGPASFAFAGNASAGIGSYVCNGTVTGVDGAYITFVDTSTAGQGIFEINGTSAVSPYFPEGRIMFEGNSTADQATITANGGLAVGTRGGRISLSDDATAANATFIVNGATVPGADGAIFSMAGAATSEMARLQVYGNGIIDLKAHRPGDVTFGSLQGDGRVQLGDVNLVLGEGDFGSTFSGIIRGVSGGSVTKTGAGVVTLTRANTYTGGTSVNAGALKVSNLSGSGTGTGTVNVNSGTLGGSGIISGAVIVGTGSGGGAFLAPSVAATKPTTLTLRNSLTFSSDSTYTCRLSTKEARVDQVVANGVIVETGAEFGLSAVGNKKLRPGTIFKAINNTAETGISGAFANLPDGGTITVGINTFEASYEGGDGNDLTLTVAP